MEILKVEKSRSETYPIYIGREDELDKREECQKISSVKEIISWDYIRTNGSEAIFTDLSIVVKEEPDIYLEGLSLALRFCAENSVSLFQWMISNLYEIMDVEEDAIRSFLVKLWEAKIGIYVKKTKKEREMAPLSFLAESVLKEAGGFPYRDVVSMSMVFESHVSWKCGLLSMEEFYEIRDMFVPFGLGISQSRYKPEDLLSSFLDKRKENPDFLLLKKLGKAVPYEEVIAPEVFLNAWEELTFDETAND